MLNWLARYAFVNEMLGFDGDGNLTESVLDVGCGPYGLACAAPGASFVGLDVNFPPAGRAQDGGVPQRSRAAPLRRWGVRHRRLPGRSRARPEGEPLRASRGTRPRRCPARPRRVPLKRARLGSRRPAGQLRPARYSATRLAERARRAWVARPRGDPHTACERPAGVQRTGAADDERNARHDDGRRRHPPGVRRPRRHEFEGGRDGWLRTFQAARFGSTRKGYVIRRERVRAAIVDPRDLFTTVWDAVRCPACGHIGLEPPSVRIDAPLAVCPACRHRVASDENRACDVRPRPRTVLAPDPAAPAPEPEPATLPQPATAPSSRFPPAGPAPGELAPIRATAPIRHSCSVRTGSGHRRRWSPRLSPRHPMVATRSASTPRQRPSASRRCTRCSPLSARRSPATTSSARSSSSTCRSSPTAPSRCAPRTTSGGISGIEREAAALASPQRVTAHAQAAKRLADRVAAIAQRVRFLNAPDPWTSREPLVTVRIATWRKPRLLVEPCPSGAQQGTIGTSS